MLKDLISALILLLIAFAYYYLSGDINPSALADEVGAEGLPVIYAMLLGTLALVLAAKALVAWRFISTDQKRSVNDLAGESPKVLRATGMLGIGIVYVAAVTFVGYLISLTAVIALVARYQGERWGWRLAGIALGGGVTFWIFFDRVLGVDTPPGFWPLLLGG